MRNQKTDHGITVAEFFAPDDRQGAVVGARYNHRPEQVIMLVVRRTVTVSTGPPIVTA